MKNQEAHSKCPQEQSPIQINKHINAQGSTKPLQRTYSIESMDIDTDCVVASLNLKEVLNNYNTWNYLTVSQPINLVTFLNVNLLHIIHIYLNMYKQMTNVKLVSVTLPLWKSLIWLCVSKWEVNKMIRITRNKWNHLAVKKIELRFIQKCY